MAQDRKEAAMFIFGVIYTDTKPLSDGQVVGGELMVTMPRMSTGEQVKAEVARRWPRFAGSITQVVWYYGDGEDDEACEVIWEA
jgi:hypothetical protein